MAFNNYCIKIAKQLLIIGFITTFSLQAQIVSTLSNGFSASGGIVVDKEGNIYVGDFGRGGNGGDHGNTIYKISPEGSSVEIFAQDNLLNGLTGGRFTQAGELFWSSYTGNSVNQIDSTGSVSSFAMINGPVAITSKDSDTLFVASCNTNNIMKVSPTGSVSLFASSSLFSCPNGMTMDDDNNLYVSDFTNGNIVKITSDGTASLLANIPGNANEGRAVNIVFAKGKLYVTARSIHKIYEVTLDGEASVFAGTGTRGVDNGVALEATFSLPNGIAVNPSGSKLYINDAASTGSSYHPSVLRVIDLETITSIKDAGDNILKDFKLMQNYPNPFNPATVISYTIPTPHRHSHSQGKGVRKGLFITLKIYDMLGNEISTLVNENQQPGSYSYTFYSRELSSGTYIYELITPLGNQVNKMLLIK